MPPFKSWVLGRPHRLPLDAGLYMADETLLVDRVFDYRELDSALRELGSRTGLPVPAVLPGEKTGIARDRKPWPSYYDAESRQRVADLFRREIALMGYRFDGD
jgi:hypothetical protein